MQQTTVFGAFLKVTGLQPSAHYNVLAYISEANFERAMDRWKIDGEPADLGAIGMATWAFHKARQLCHLEAPPSTATLTTPVVPPPATPATGQLSSNGQLLNVSTIKVSQVMDQRFGEEITYLPNAEIQKMRARYVDAYDEPPRAEIACNKEQLACLKHALDSGREPYADLAVWGPYATRLLKKASMSGLNIMRDGTFMTVELFGPPNIELWEGCYDVLATGCLMLGAVKRPRLAAYKRWIIKLATLYGPVVWHLLYQTDVRCRSELMQAVFQEMLAAHNAAVMSNTHTTFDVLNPWDSVWARVLEMKDWWIDEFERPAGLINSKVMSMNSVISGDVQIATTYHPQSPAQLNVTSQLKGKGQPSKPNKRKREQQQLKGQKGAGSPSNASAASQLWCKICKATDHNHFQCPSFDQNHGKNKGKKGANKGGKDKGKATK